MIDLKQKWAYRNAPTVQVRVTRNVRTEKTYVLLSGAGRYTASHTSIGKFWATPGEHSHDLVPLQTTEVKPSMGAKFAAAVAKSDPVNHPKHYTSHPSGVECIDIVRHMPFNLGNVVKYIWRAGIKDQTAALQDLEKAAFYLADEIAMRKREAAKS